MEGKHFSLLTIVHVIGDLLWTFNDPASGAIQQAVVDNPVYSFVGNSPYSVQLQVTNACGVTSSETKSVVGISYTETQTDVSCPGKKDGNIALQMNGGTAPFSYQWNTSPISNTSSISNLDTGKYIVRINDSKNCEASDTFHLNYLPAIEDTFTIRVETCGEGNGSITVQTVGGSSPYNYNWSNSATGNLISNLSAATYFLTTTDSKGCTSTSSVLLNGTLSVPAKIVELNANKCFGDSIGILQALPLAGSAPFAYQWSTSSLALDTLKNLSAGIYQVTITDKNNCSGMVSYTLSSPTALQQAFQTSQAFCEQPVGIIQSVTNGGTFPYSYAWSDGSASSTISGLMEGFYYLTITDAHQCSSIDSVNIISTLPLAYTFEISDDTCSRKTGQIIIHPISGTSPFYYNWENGFSLDSILKNVAGGNYSILIKDSVGCMDTLDFSIPVIAKNYGQQMDTAFCFERNTFQLLPGKFIDYLWSKWI